MQPLARCAALALALAPCPAAAGDVWTSPHPGVRHLHRTARGLDLHVVVVDLRAPGVSLVATRPEDRFITTSEFARRYGARVAINANFYRHGSCGLAVGGARVFADSYEDGCTASLGFGAAGAVLAFDSSSIPRGPVPEPWVSEVLTGKPWLLRGGRAAMNWQRPQHLYRPNPRSAVGVTADRSRLVLLAADGRRRGVEGITGFQMVAVLREFGVADAVNLDGGGSTTLVVDGRVANRPAYRAQRRVVTHLGVVIDGAGEPPVAPSGGIALRADARSSGDAGASRSSGGSPEPPPPPPSAARAEAPPARPHPAVAPPRGGSLGPDTPARAGAACDAAPGRSPSPLAWSALAVFGSLVAAVRRRRDRR